MPQAFNLESQNIIDRSLSDYKSLISFIRVFIKMAVNID